MRIVMIMNFKKHTYKMTLVSVFILFTVGVIFFTSASGFSNEDRKSDAGINSKTAYEDVKNLNEVDSPPRVIRLFSPAYPAEAKEQGLNGRVVLRFVVDIEGYAGEPEVVSAEPEGVFEEAALDAVAEYRFKPALKDGKPVNCIVKMPIEFRMSEDDEEILE
jgi:protein TonB